jgi:hypothetical protein
VPVGEYPVMRLDAQLIRDFVAQSGEDVGPEEPDMVVSQTWGMLVHWRVLCALLHLLTEEQRDNLVSPTWQEMVPPQNQSSTISAPAEVPTDTLVHIESSTNAEDTEAQRLLGGRSPTLMELSPASEEALLEQSGLERGALRVAGSNPRVNGGASH